jgi:hypothetical protein
MNKNSTLTKIDSTLKKSRPKYSIGHNEQAEGRCDRQKTPVAKNIGAEYKFLGTCIHLPAIHVTRMVEHAKDVKYNTLEKYVTKEQLSHYFPDYYWGKSKKNDIGQKKILLKDDYAVSFHKSQYFDIPCYYVRWSAIEYVFIKTEGEK